MLRWLRCLHRPRLVIWRSGSSYVARMRYLVKLKGDDEACSAALRAGRLFLYHKLRPLLMRAEGGRHRPLDMKTTDVEALLEKLGQQKERVRESVLVGCTETWVPQFCLDVGTLEKCAVERLCGGEFVDLRKAFFLLRGHDVPHMARGRALLHWHQTHGFCSASGEPTVKNQAGSQRVCQGSGHTYYPQMAPVLIVLVSDGSRCLLGRQAAFPRDMYSALAGFCDMGETMEETLRREVAEEVGLEVETFQFASTQHWPYPQSSFMLACHATVNPQRCQVSVDKVELEDARWFTLEEIQEALRRASAPQAPGGGPPVFWLPPSFTIAHQLVQEWVRQQTAGV